MPIVIDPPPVDPVWEFPYNFGALSYWLSDRHLDPHAWLSIADGGGITYSPEACTLAALPLVRSLCPPADIVKSTPQLTVRPAAGPFEAQWFDVAGRSSTVSCPDPNPLLDRSLDATIELFVEEAIAVRLAAAAIVQLPEPSIECAVEAAIQTLAAIHGDGRGIIHLSARAAARLLEGHLLQIVNGGLVDPFGNLYRVARTLAEPNTLYVEAEAGYEIWLSPKETLPPTDDRVRDLNERILRKESGFILTQTACSVGSIGYAPC